MKNLIYSFIIGYTGVLAGGFTARIIDGNGNGRHKIQTKWQKLKIYGVGKYIRR
jgi:hypothetical protein